jgi:hypothetical protein
MDKFYFSMLIFVNSNVILSLNKYQNLSLVFNFEDERNLLPLLPLLLLLLLVVVVVAAAAVVAAVLAARAEIAMVVVVVVVVLAVRGGDGGDGCGGSSSSSSEGNYSIFFLERNTNVSYNLNIVPSFPCL